MQLDEKWAFVGKKQKHCNPADPADWLCGDQWDHVALDPDSRLILEVVVGPRTSDSAELLLQGVRDRLGGRAPELVTSDEYPAYEAAILEVYLPRDSKMAAAAIAKLDAWRKRNTPS